MLCTAFQNKFFRFAKWCSFRDYDPRGDASTCVATRRGGSFASPPDQPIAKGSGRQGGWGNAVNVKVVTHDISPYHTSLRRGIAFPFASSRLLDFLGRLGHGESVFPANGK